MSTLLVVSLVMKILIVQITQSSDIFAVFLTGGFPPSERKNFLLLSTKFSEKTQGLYSFPKGKENTRLGQLAAIFCERSR